MAAPRALTPAQARATLAHRLTRRVDRLRQLETRFGLRARRVFLVWTRWSGDEPGAGVERVVRRVEILPTPRVADATALNLRPWSGGTLPEGGLRVDEISAGAYTVDVLMGRRYAESSHEAGCACGCRGPSPSSALAVTGTDDDPRQDPLGDFFYEVVEDGRGDDPAERERFRLSGRPWRDERGFQFGVVLEPTSDQLARDGSSRNGLDLAADEQVDG